MFYLCDCCCYKQHKWTLYIFSVLFGGMSVAFLVAAIVWYIHDIFILPNHIVEMCLATSILVLFSNIIGFRGARRADDVHEHRGRNYLLFLFVCCTVAVSIIVAVQVHMGDASLMIVSKCGDEPLPMYQYPNANPDCPLDLYRYLAQWQNYFVSNQNAWGCCGLDTNDFYAMSPAWNSTCQPWTELRSGCRGVLMANAFLLCVAILALSCTMLVGLVICAIAAICLSCCRFPHVTIEGYALDGHEFSFLGRQRSLNDQLTKRQADQYKLMEGGGH